MFYDNKFGFIILLFITSLITLSACSDNHENSINKESIEKNTSIKQVDENPKIIDNSSRNEQTKGNIETAKESTAEDYKNAIDEKTKSIILKVVNDYYSELSFLKIKSLDETTDITMYQNKGIEDQYSIGDILVFDVVADDDGIETYRSISVAKNSSGDWKVINEGV